MHLWKPEISDGFIPDFLPKNTIHIIAFVLEISLGIGILIPKFSYFVSRMILILMNLFLIIHIIDLFKKEPVIGNHTIATIRIVIQLLFIYLSWKLMKMTKVD